MAVLLRIGEVARQCGVTADAVRHYEKLGLLKPATLADLQRFLRARDRGGAPCRDVRAAAAARLVEVDGRIRELQDLRGLLERLLVTWDEKLDSTPDGVQSRLLDMLPGETS